MSEKKYFYEKCDYFNEPHINLKYEDVLKMTLKEFEDWVAMFRKTVVEVWNETAKFAGNYVKKGTLILVVGELRYEKFEDKDGKPQTRAKIHATKIQLLPKGAGSNQNGASTGASASAGDSAAAKQQAEEYASTTSAEFVGSSADDDLPF